MWWFIEPLMANGVLFMFIIYIPTLIYVFVKEDFNKLSKVIFAIGALPSAVSFVLMIINILVYGFVNAWKPYF